MNLFKRKLDDFWKDVGNKQALLFQPIIHQVQVQDPESRDPGHFSQSRIPGLALTVKLLSTPATMLQVATAFFYSWQTRPIVTNERCQS